MKSIASRFKFVKSQRSGMLYLILLIFIFQIIYFTIDFTESKTYFDANELIAFQQQIDSLKTIEIKNRKPKIYPFNPNFISDFKGSKLGMSTKEIDRLHAFRSKNKYVNSAKEFQKITKVSDSLLATMSPYFKFPDWVTKRKSKKQYQPKNFSKSTHDNTQKSFLKIDLNTATAEQLKTVYGIGEKLSVRIVKYRAKIGGFISKDQLYDVYGLKPDVIQRVQEQFPIKTKPKIHKIAINTCTLEELLKVPYVNYTLADEIINQRILREGFKSFDELLKIPNFPVKKIEIIKLYLTLD